MPAMNINGDHSFRSNEMSTELENFESTKLLHCIIAHSQFFRMNSSDSRTHNSTLSSIFNLVKFYFKLFFKKSFDSYRARDYDQQRPHSWVIK